MPRTADRDAPRRLVFSNANAITVVPWDEEPLHRTLLASPLTRIYEARLAPGQATLFHSHTADHTAYVVAAPPGGATVINEVAVAGADPPQGETMRVTAGDTFSFCCRDGALIHRISVPAGEGAGPHFVGVEVKPRVQGGAGAAPAPSLPPPFETTVDGDTFFIAKLKLAPGASMPPFPAPTTPAVVVVVAAPSAGVSGSGAVVGAGREPGGFALWEGGDGGGGETWSVANEGGSEYEVGVVVWK
jgi:hypothetical protein